MPHRAFNDPASLAASLADDVAAAISQHLESRASAAIVVPGGRTPAPFLRALAQHPLPWSRVQVMLADDRCVPPDDAASNLRMVREAFAGTAAADSLIVIDPSQPDAAAQWEARLDALPTPFAAVVVGMGSDGHFASLFPGMPGIAAALDPDGHRGVVHGLAPVDPRQRLSLTLAALLDTPLLALHLSGADKLATLQRASSPGSVLEMPVRALLQQRRVPLRVYHAP
jgi:6-phosphogluconolactonase